MMKKNPYPLPTTSGGDALYALAKAGISSVPIIGGAATELFSFLISAPLEKRRDDWMLSVGEALLTLQQKVNLDFDELARNEAFLDTVIRVSQLAIRTSQSEKLKIFQNVITNRALNTTVDLSTQHILLDLVDSLTPLHIATLSVFRTGKIGLANRKANGEPLDKEAKLYHGFPALRNNFIGSKIWNDLLNEGLISEVSEGEWWTADGTELGRELLKLISTPLEQDPASAAAP
jgi:hypothetical protein